MAPRLATPTYGKTEPDDFDGLLRGALSSRSSSTTQLENVDCLRTRSI